MAPQRHGAFSFCWTIAWEPLMLWSNVIRYLALVGQVTLAVAMAAAITELLKFITLSF
jgi:hypothetical protein